MLLSPSHSGKGFGTALQRYYNGIRTALLLYGNPVNKHACQNRLTGMFATFT